MAPSLSTLFARIPDWNVRLARRPKKAPTTQWPFFVAFCSEGWFQFNDEKCVRIISSQALNFYESQELCRSKYNSKLLSIKSDKESEFLHNLIKFRDVKLPVWLGAVQNDFSSFNWIDKSEVTFTNWAEGEPNDPDHACLSMTASGAKWADNDCKEQKLILCQKGEFRRRSLDCTGRFLLPLLVVLASIGRHWRQLPVAGFSWRLDSLPSQREFELELELEL